MSSPRSRRVSAPVAALGAIAALLAALFVTFLDEGAANAAPTTSTTSAKTRASTVHLCPVTPARGQATCYAVARVAAGGVKANTAGARTVPGGLKPADLTAAYNLPSRTAGTGQTIAIVDAYGYPTAETDLAVYRAQFGLASCTQGNHCFRKVNQTGGTAYPRYDLGWAQETALDLEMASAVCPRCKILLVEANSPAFTDLGAAVNTAVRLGATVVSNSYGGNDASDSSMGQFFNHPGVAITASSGDNGYEGASYPASSSYVTAVGGTSLTKTTGTGRGWTETAWSGSGSGCSQFNVALEGASAFNTGCANRAMSDVAAVADPNTGVAVYAPVTKYASGWQVYGGTSASAPIIAGVFALAGNAASTTPSYPYHHAGSLNDVVSGRNGSCTPAQWCNAGTGWDGPTGLGTPNGVGAF